MTRLLFCVVCVLYGLACTWWALRNADRVDSLRKALQYERAAHQAVRHLANRNLVQAAYAEDPEDILPSEY